MPSAPGLQMYAVLVALSLLPLTTGADAHAPSEQVATAAAPPALAAESTLAAARAPRADGPVVITVSRDGEPDLTHALGADARVWQGPLPADWRRITCVGEQAVCLPVDRGASSEVLVRLTAYPRATLTASWPAAVAGQTVRAMVNRQTAAGDSAFGPARGQWQVLARPDGRFSLDVPQGTLDIRLLANGCAAVYRFDVKAGANTALGPLPCVPGGSIAARVRDSQSGDTVPACVATVRPSGPRVETDSTQDFAQMMMQSARCNEFGFFQMTGLAAGWYHVATDSGTHVPDIAELEVIDMAEAAVDLWLTAFRTLPVRVSPPVAPDGRPWVLRLRSKRFTDPTHGWARATVGPSGEVRFSRVSPDEHEFEILTQDEQLITALDASVPADDSPLNITIPLVRIIGQVSQRHQPIAGATVEIEDNHNQQTFTTDDSGTFTGWIRKPHPEQRSLLARVSGPRSAGRFGRMSSFQYRDEHTMVLNLELGSSRVTATVVDTTGTPVSGVPVTLTGRSTPGTPENPPTLSAIETNASGAVVIDGVVPGRYTAYGSHFTGDIQPMEIDIPADSDFPVQLAFVRRREHILDVVSSQGVPLAGTTVIIKSDTVLLQQARQTDSRGQVTLSVAEGSGASTLSVLADSQMLWSGCINLSAGNRTRLTLPAPLSGTLRLALPHSYSGTPVLVSETGGLLKLSDLAHWQRTEVTEDGERAVDIFEVRGIAAGRYRPMVSDALYLMSLVQAACAGAISFDDPSAGTLTPGGVLELKWPMPR